MWEIHENLGANFAEKRCLKINGQNFHVKFLGKFCQKLICFALFLMKKDSNFAVFARGNGEIFICSFNNNALKKWANGKAFTLRPLSVLQH